jgi:lipid II:glycine glycyltransferase (peptidoglycan interpeptide bridge formation enzyme)
MGALMHSPRGPLLAPDANALALTALSSAVRDLANRVGGMFWRVEPPVRESDSDACSRFGEAGFLRVPQEWSYWNRPKYDMHLNISDGEAAVFSRISSRTRGKIRYAPKRGVVVEVGHTERDVKIFYELLMNTGNKKRIPVKGLEYFTHLCAMLEKSGLGRLFIAHKDQEPVAAGISSRFGTVGALLYLSNDYSVKYAGWAVQWEMIRWAIAEGCQLYDFAGTGTSFPPKETDKGYGVYQFKRSFGAEIVAWYGYADYVFKPLHYRLFRTIERSLPYGERVLLDWPKGLLFRLRHRKSIAKDDDAS